MSDPTLQLVAGLIVIVVLFGGLLGFLSVRGARTRRDLRAIEERARPRFGNTRHADPSLPRATSGLATTGFGVAPRYPRLSAIVGVDPNFSELDFLEAAAALYAWAHKLRPRRDYITLRSFLADPALDTFLSGMSDLDSVSDIRVGEVRPTRVYVDAEWTSVELSFRSVQIERIKDEFQEVWRVENWRLRRRSDVHSPARETLLALACPLCDSRALADEKGVCPDCGRLRCGPTVHWQVAAVGDVRRNPYPPQPTQIPLGPPVLSSPPPEEPEPRRAAFFERHPAYTDATLRTVAIECLKLALSPEGVELEGPLGRRLRYEAEQLAATRTVRRFVPGEVSAVEILDFHADATHELVDVAIQLPLRAWIEREDGAVPTQAMPFRAELTMALDEGGEWLPLSLRWSEIGAPE